MTIKQRLTKIQQASGWSQEQLATQLGVSFATLNAWINERAVPRVKAQQNIERLYLDIVGVDAVDEQTLTEAKQIALKRKTSTQAIAKNQDQLNALTLHLTYHTNTIEGSTMTLSDVEEVLFEHKVLANRTAIEQAEARNHQATLYWLLEELTDKKKDFVIDEQLILGIHLRLMNGIMSGAGQYCTHSVRIMGTTVPLVNWQKIPEQIAQLVRDIAKLSDDIIADIAKTHATFEQIHPFADGNGRTGRLIMLAQALQAGLLPPLVVKERKYAYYKYLEQAQTKQDYQPLEFFVTQSMQFTSELFKNKHECLLP